ncbi:MAG: tRNA (guanosine(37)-N1)-methyltransferase TrmD [Candidatus Paceibacterota bacterium]|jgi:tRNA (guanine37-N1)-methyltransferase
MQFDIITIFPKIFESYFNESILGRAQKNKMVRIAIHDLRDFAHDKHKTVDDSTYGGGAGMVLKIEPIFEMLKHLKIIKKDGTRVKRSSNDTKVILMSAKGEIYNQKIAVEMSKIKRVVIICGRYEGVDERVSKYLVDEDISIGKYVLTGGEIPAMALVDSISRLIPGVVGNKESIEDESFSKEGYLEYPQYTRPELFSPVKGVNWRVPGVLLSGDHSKIKEWREKMSVNGNKIN